MIDRFIKKLIPLVLIATISIVGVTSIVPISLVMARQSTLITSVKAAPKKKMAIDAAVAKATIAQLLSKIDKTPEQPTIKRTSVEGNYAIATWTWGEAGGQTILARKQGRWQVLIAGGGAVDFTTLKEKGVPEKIARILMQKETAALKK